VRLLGSQRAAGGLSMKPELLRPRVCRAEAVAHDVRPEASRGAEFGDLLEKVVVRVEKEREALTERVDVEIGGDRRFDVRHGVGECKGDLLNGGRAGFP